MEGLCSVILLYQRLCNKYADEIDALKHRGETMRIVDLYCKAGGASKGLHDAFPEAEIVGIDIEPQPNYPFGFWHYDVTKLTPSAFENVDFIWASPPCQSFTAYRRKGHGVGDGYPNLIPFTRDLLKATGKPYVIENVHGAPLERPITLCGSMFDLDVRRHRLFEASFPIEQPPCRHDLQLAKGRRFPSATNNKYPRSTVEVGVWRIPLDVQQKAMGIDWMTREELSEAIPPSYSQYVLEQWALSAAAEKACVQPRG